MREIKAHTGLRGIAAISVFLGHAEFDHAWQRPEWWLLPYRLFYWQVPAVDLFFMLSGFVLNFVYLKQRRLQWGDYLAARFARICPLYYAGMAAVLAMNYYAARHGFPPSSNLEKPVIIRNLLMIQDWPVGPMVASIDKAAWSISVEMFLYLVTFPVLVVLLVGRRISNRILLPVLVGLLVVNSVTAPENIYQVDFAYSGLIRGILGFVAGFIVCELMVERNRPWLNPKGELLLALATLAAVPNTASHFVLPFAFAALIATTYHEESWLGQHLGGRFLAFFGAISYSVYIWHLPVIKACTIFFRVREMGAHKLKRDITDAHMLVYFGATIVIVLVVSTLSYYWFESPLRRLLRKRNRDRGLVPESADWQSKSPFALWPLLIHWPAHGWTWLILFAVYRLADFLKPWPANQLQSLRGGLGILVDDLVSSAYMGLALMAWTHLFPNLL